MLHEMVMETTALEWAGIIAFSLAWPIALFFKATTTLASPAFIILAAMFLPPSAPDGSAIVAGTVFFILIASFEVWAKLHD